MPIYIKTTLIGLALLFVGVIVLIPFLTIANQSGFIPRESTSSSTTTPNYLAWGTGTTTIEVDAYSYGASTKIDEAILLVQFHASSTASSTLAWRYQFSNNGIDWYNENQFLNLNATTTVISHGFHNYTWRQISTTTEQSTIGNGFATSSQSSRAIAIPTPTRYTRVIFTNPGDADYDDNNGISLGDDLSLYAEFISTKEQRR